MNDIDAHEILIEAGLELHESRKYSEALTCFQEAAKQSPHCVAAQYNLANTHGGESKIDVPLRHSATSVFFALNPLHELIKLRT